jgi:PIN domain nuclease of toxin-antitoxin system
LLDTHILIWMAMLPDRLGPTARAALEDESNSLFMSLASFWELAIKIGKGKLDLDLAELHAHVTGLGVREVPLSLSALLRLPALVTATPDPFDRLLLCSARSEGLTLLTQDQLLAGQPAVLMG